MENVIVAIVGALAAVVVAVIQNRRLEHERQHAAEQLKQAKDELIREKIAAIGEVRSSFIEPPPLAKGEKRNSIILLGLGNSGKTQFISNLLDAEDANPMVKTPDYSIYHKRIEPASKIFGKTTGVQERTVTNLYVSDYLGQNIGNLVRSFLLQQKLEHSPMTFGYVNSLIVVVDGVSVPTVEDRHQRISPERIKENLAQWNQSAIDAIKGFYTKERFSYVCLFVNKMDAVRNSGEKTAERDFAEKFEPIAAILKKDLASSVRFEMVVGSALTGDGLQTIRRHLIETASNGAKNE